MEILVKLNTYFALVQNFHCKYILYTKYVTEPPMKITTTRQLAAVEYIDLYMINDCNSVTLVMGRCNKRECFPGPWKTGVERTLIIRLSTIIAHRVVYQQSLL